MWIKFTVVDNGSLLVVVNGVRYLVTTVKHPVFHALLTIAKIMVARVYSCVPKAIVARFKVAGIYYHGMALILIMFQFVKYFCSLLYSVVNSSVRGAVFDNSAVHNPILFGSAVLCRIGFEIQNIWPDCPVFAEDGQFIQFSGLLNNEV